MSLARPARVLRAFFLRVGSFMLVFVFVFVFVLVLVLAFVLILAWVRSVRRFCDCIGGLGRCGKHWWWAQHARWFWSRRSAEAALGLSARARTLEGTRSTPRPPLASVRPNRHSVMICFVTLPLTSSFSAPIASVPARGQCAAVSALSQRIVCGCERTFTEDSVRLCAHFHRG